MVLPARSARKLAATATAPACGLMACSRASNGAALPRRASNDMLPMTSASRARARQRTMLAQTLGVVVRYVDRLDDIMPEVEALGRRHASYGVEIEHYAIVGTALLWALEQTLGDQRIQRLPHGHPGNTEAGDQFTFGRRCRPGWLRFDEASDVLTHLDVLQRPLARNDDVHLLHAGKARTGLDRRPEFDEATGEALTLS